MTRTFRGDPQPSSGICRVLSWEHDQILREADRLVGAGADPEGLGRRKELFERLRRNLVLHIRAEEAVLYPAIRGIHELRDFARHSRLEHDALESMVRELEAIDVSNWRWGMKLRHFAIELEHHLQDEEEELFPRILRKLSRARQTELEREYWVARRRLEAELGGIAEEGMAA